MVWTAIAAVGLAAIGILGGVGQAPAARAQEPPTALPPAARLAVEAALRRLAGTPEPATPTGEGPETIRATVGQTFTVRLASNRTTGYRWDLAQPLDEQIVQFVSADYLPEAPGRPGAGGLEVWTFLAVGPGTTTIVLEYRRPFEVGVPPARVQSVSVVVE